MKPVRSSRGFETLAGVLSIDRRARKRGFHELDHPHPPPAVVDGIGEDGVVTPRIGEQAPRAANPHLVAKGSNRSPGCRWWPGRTSGGALPAQPASGHIP